MVTVATSVSRGGRVEPFPRNDYETEARKALQKGDIASAHVYATLHQASLMKELTDYVRSVSSTLDEVKLGISNIGDQVEGIRRHT